MTTNSSTLTQQLLTPAPRVRTGLPADSLRFDRWFTVLATLFMLGIYIDGWAHNNLAELIETFFTPWHALLYGGFFITAGFLTVALARNLAAGHRFTEALPRGYFPALIGAGIFLFGGVFDLFWHTLFGFEADTEALLSPAHLVLAAGAFLIFTAPLRALWQRPSHTGEMGWAQLWPAVVSMTLFLSLLTFFTQYATPARPGVLIETPIGGGEHWLENTSGIFNLLMPSLLVMGSLLFLLRRWQLPFGCFTLFIGGNYTLMFLMAMDEALEAPLTLGAILLAAVIIDLLYRWLQPSAANSTALRYFAFLVPFTMAALYLASLLLTHGLWWQIHMWGGVPVVCGVAGLFLSFLTNPPALPTAQEAA
jgi:hypothetical protein